MITNAGNIASPKYASRPNANIRPVLIPLLLGVLAILILATEKFPVAFSNRHPCR
jgi:hypothetical protein